MPGFSNCGEWCDRFVEGRLACWCVHWCAVLDGEAVKVKWGQACGVRALDEQLVLCNEAGDE